jgi:hypothetical protein
MKDNTNSKIWIKLLPALVYPTPKLSDRDEGTMNKLLKFLHPLWDPGIVEIISLQ